MIRLTDPTRVGAIVADLRVMHLLSQRQYATQIGITQARLSDWETGKAMPTLPLLVPAFGYFDLDLALIRHTRAQVDPGGRVTDWPIPKSEAYCVDSGRPVRYEAGDRCLSHGNRADMCTTALRDPRCTHPRLSPNHPHPHCSECGLDGRVVEP